MIDWERKVVEISGGKENKEEGGVAPSSMKMGVPLTMPATFTSCSADDRTRKERRSVSVCPRPRASHHLFLSV